MPYITLFKVNLEILQDLRFTFVEKMRLRHIKSGVFGILRCMLKIRVYYRRRLVFSLGSRRQSGNRPRQRCTCWLRKVLKEGRDLLLKFIVCTFSIYISCLNKPKTSWNRPKVTQSAAMFPISTEVQTFRFSRCSA